MSILYDSGTRYRRRRRRSGPTSQRPSGIAAIEDALNTVTELSEFFKEIKENEEKHKKKDDKKGPGAVEFLILLMVLQFPVIIGTMILVAKLLK